jgi:hypothetical protein
MFVINYLCAILWEMALNVAVDISFGNILDCKGRGEAKSAEVTTGLQVTQPEAAMGRNVKELVTADVCVRAAPVS